VTGYCGYLLYAGLADNETAKGEYESARSGLDTLQRKTPSPTPENIKVAEADAERVKAFLADFRKCFASFPPPPPLAGDRAFKDFLEQSIQRFRAEATNAGVELPPDYAFSFSQQLDKLDYPPECIQPWMQQLEEIEAILRILYDAKINYLEEIKRPSTGINDMGGGDVFLVTGAPNAWGDVSSYVVSFRAFSPEIASVLAGIAGSSNCFIVKAIYVLPSRVPLPQVTQAQPVAAPAQTIQYFRPPPQIQSRPTAPNMGFNRSAGGSHAVNPQFARPAAPPPVAAVPAAQPVVPAAPETILRETPLFVTLYVDVVKLKAPEVVAKPKTRAP
jgi:hypothetical protein